MSRVSGLEARRAETERLREEITAKVYEAVGDTYQALFERVLADAGLSIEQQENAREVLVRELQALALGGDPA